jgi:signal transduction histidine kinase
VGRVAGRRLAVAAVLVAGGALCAALSVSSSMSATDAGELVLLAGATALVTAAVSALVLQSLRHRSLALQVTVLACVPILAVVIGSWFGARQMFLSEHDLSVVSILLVAAGSVALIAAIVLGARVMAGSEALIEATRALPEGPMRLDANLASREQLRLARELNETATALELSRERERALEASRRELIAWVSHDLRTPLAGIRAIAEALEDGLVTDDRTLIRYYGTLNQETDRLSGLVDDLFELSKAQSGVISRELDRFVLGDLVSDALAGIAPVADAKGVRLEGRLDGEPAELSGAPSELLRALRNILENAVRHTPADGSVIVEARVDGDHAVVSVLDTGGGIREEDLPRVFDVGWRGDPARPKDGGAGLGLAIAREVARAHEGDIDVSNENGGARFVLRLPVERDDSSV